MVNRVTFLAQISTLSYIVKNFKLGFLKKGSPKKFKTQDLKWSLSTCKKLLKHFFWDIFLFQGISEDRCGSWKAVLTPEKMEQKLGCTFLKLFTHKKI